MESRYRKGQTLIETLILVLLVFSFFVFLEVSHEKMYQRSNHFKIQRQTF